MSNVVEHWRGLSPICCCHTLQSFICEFISCIQVVRGPIDWGDTSLLYTCFIYNTSSSSNTSSHIIILSSFLLRSYPSPLRTRIALTPFFFVSQPIPKRTAASPCLTPLWQTCLSQGRQTKYIYVTDTGKLCRLSYS